LTPEKKAVQRLCMAFDIYYRDDVFTSAMNKIKTSGMNISPMAQYMKQIQLSQYNRYNETYENTITEAEQESFAMSSITDISNETTIDQKTIDFFGSGFTDEDYKFLKKEYEDWTARHECKTKAQEENFKDICFNRLQNLKALRRGEDTKDIAASFQKMLEDSYRADYVPTPNHVRKFFDLSMTYAKEAESEEEWYTKINEAAICWL
jgi:hypothetical protein